MILLAAQEFQVKATLEAAADLTQLSNQAAVAAALALLEEMQSATQAAWAAMDWRLLSLAHQ
jgi:hypothetical protein